MNAGGLCERARFYPSAHFHGKLRAVFVQIQLMKLHLNSTVDQYAINGYGEGFVLVNGRRHENNILVLPDKLEPGWLSGGFEDLTEAHFIALAGHAPDIVLLGTGSHLRFPHPSLYAGLMAQGIGVEIMDLGAACRTYNYLSAEGRRVAAALIVQSD